MKERNRSNVTIVRNVFFIKNKLEFTHLIYSWRTNTIQLWYLCLDFLILSGLPNKSYVSLQVEIVTITSLANRTWNRIFPIMSVTNFCSHSKQFWISSQLLDLICKLCFNLKCILMLKEFALHPQVSQFLNFSLRTTKLFLFKLNK